MNYISCQNIQKSFGSRILFNNISLGVNKGDKVGLIGPNGSGKSTLLKLIAGLEEPDEGSIARSRYLKVGYLPQEVDFPSKTALEIVASALHKEDHERETKASILLGKLGFPDPNVNATSLSGGWKKRLGLAVQLIIEPDLVLLDEPTNHLDLEGVLWLEKFLRQASFAFMVISHDRYFLEHITSRMIELNRSYPKGLFATDGSYSQFVEKRAEFLSGQQSQEGSLSSKVRREVEWLKQNPKARTTKSQSRINQADKLIQELDDLKDRNKTSRSRLEFSSTQRDTRKLVTATNLTKSMGGKLLFEGIDLNLSPGSRLGIVGLNGSGKTTFLRLLMGELTPDKGTLKYADNVKILYFDQHRKHIPPETTLRRALAPQGEYVQFQGQTIHVNGWCKRFLFSPDRLDLPFGQLSGGEKARVHIAGLTRETADVLLLDEPTNDLDIETLEILEESLKSFPGAIVLISHDRYFLDSVSTFIMALGMDQENPFFADYRQWEQAHAELMLTTPAPAKPKEAPTPARKPTKKLGYSEQRELDQIEPLIEKLEAETSSLSQEIEHLQDPSRLSSLCQQLEEKQAQLQKAYARWEELEAKRESL